MHHFYLYASENACDIVQMFSTWVNSISTFLMYTQWNFSNFSLLLSVYPIGYQILILYKASQACPYFHSPGYVHYLAKVLRWLFMVCGAEMNSYCLCILVSVSESFLKPVGSAWWDIHTFLTVGAFACLPPPSPSLGPMKERFISRSHPFFFSRLKS